MSAPPSTALAETGPSSRTRSRYSALWTVRAPISRRTYWVLATIGVLTPLLAWVMLSAWSGIDAVFVPAPLQVLSKVWTWATENSLMKDMAISIYRVVAGFVLSAVIALPLALSRGLRGHGD